MHGHAEIRRWRGQALSALNRQYGDDDSRSQRTTSTTKLPNPSPTTANDPGHIKLAEALPEP